MTAYKLLLVDDDPNAVQLMCKILSGVGDLRFATNGADALRLARETLPDLMVLDAEMPGMSGFEVCEELKSDAALRHIPVIFVTSHSDSHFEVAGFEIGAADFLAKPPNPALVMARVKAQLRIKRMSDELLRIATVDWLTSVANRRSFDEALESEWLRCRRSGDPLALLLIDVDHFKRYNDHYGHQAGDTCLRALGKAMRGACLRPGDLAARYGGEEFAMLLPKTPRVGAVQVAQRLLRAIKALGIAHAGSPDAALVTVSIGVACYDDASATWSEPSADSRFCTNTARRSTAEDLVRAADKAMYAAKAAGRAQAMLLDVADVDSTEMTHETGSRWQALPERLLA